ncbi:DUF2061 domain-containing protein [uncultured Winogradskyella sp.]|uniref:DUF2061 domain-containing protein n=1 Tax=uncultured Winogradskyella sp. TaxID=395353 RepID=UPI002617D75B|nr:DUF2061 domain-containing protein [uncultured Winogradskyella sp.]
MDNVIQTDLSLAKEEQTFTEPQENIKRSIVKTISWRVVGTLATVTISYLITGTMALAFSIGGIELVSKMALYFFHERTWNNIKWGK